jgi:hypothetical protein
MRGVDGLRHFKRADGVRGSDRAISLAFERTPSGYQWLARPQRLGSRAITLRSGRQQPNENERYNPIFHGPVEALNKANFLIKSLVA